MSMYTCSVWPKATDGEFVRALKTLVPGVRVSDRTSRVEVTVPDHGVHTLIDRFAEAQIRHDWQKAPTPRPTMAFPERLNRLVEQGVIKPDIPALLTEYQKDGLTRAVSRQGHHMWWPCGSGKTLAGVLWSLSHTGPHVVVTRSAALFTWYREVRARTNIEPHVWLPPSLRKKKHEDLDAYQKRVSRPFVIVSWESLPAAMPELSILRPHTVAYDEIHRSKSHKRWKAVPNEDGTLDFQKLENIAASASDLSKLVLFRLALTATPIRDRVRDLWAQLDLVEPGSWGKYWDWATRYCAARPGTFGGMDDKGASNLEELEFRLRYVVHRVQPEEVSAMLPPKRRQCVFLPVAEQCKAAGSWTRALQKAQKEGKEATLEVKLAEAASRKRKWILDTLSEAAQSAQKVVVLTGRRNDVDIMGAEATKSLPPTAQIWATHGDSSPEERDTVCQAWLKAAGPAILIATGDSIGESLNLQDADLMIVAMLPWTPGQIMQYEGRVARLGQNRPVLIQYVIAEETVDERVAEMLLNKLPSVAALTGDNDVAALRTSLVGTENKDELLDEVAAVLAGLDLSDIVIDSGD
jgi:superfamily II DNA or RNA helicase